VAFLIGIKGRRGLYSEKAVTEMGPVEM